MAHHAEPMDIDDESDFDNKENTFHHTNVLPRTPCTEKGYEELDVSELNMKLRYSITPASSPMSKSMSHCLDNRYYASTDESLNNTVINEYENNLTRSLNSTLNNTEWKSSKALPLQALPPDSVDSNRTTSVLRPLDSSVATNDITITVSNENEIDNLSFPSSSSSMAQTPEATTPTKEIPKPDGGSPIMRGLKSVLSMFRSSQSPIPPGEEEVRAPDTAVSPNLLPESKPQAVASTPKHENSKEKSLSRRNSPLKESIVFNEDLEKELQWNDDSTIVFSTEKIPIHKLFFQEKSSKSTILNENLKHEDANSTVEYMDVSYNDLSIRDNTLSGTVNKSKANDPAESDGEFVDCETTFTQNESYSNTEELTENINNDMPNVPEQELVKNIAVVNKPHIFDTTKDIINLLDSSHTVVEGDLAKKLDFSTTDIVNQLSDLINEISETNETNVTSIKTMDAVILNNTETSTLNAVQSENIQPELIPNQVTSSVNPVNAGDNVLAAVAEQVSIQNENLVDTAGVNTDAVISDVESNDPQISLAYVDADFLKMPQVSSETPKHDEAVNNKPLAETKIDTSDGYPSPVDIPLPNEDDINDNLLEDIVYTEEQDKTIPVASTSQNSLIAVLDKSITETTNDIQYTQVESQNNVITCPPSLLPTDGPLPNTDENNLVKTDNVPHKAMTVVFAPVHSAEIVQPDVIPIDVKSTEVNSIIEAVTKSNTEVTDGLSPVLAGPESTTTDSSCPPSINLSDFPLPSIDENNQIKTNDVHQSTTIVVPGSGNPDIMSVEDNTSKVDSLKEVNINKAAESNCNEIETAAVHTIPADFIKPEQQEHMEISFADTINDKINESLAMDVSMVEANINVESELCQKYQSFNSFPELPETTQVDITGTTNLSHVEIPKETENSNVVSHNEIINKDIAIESESITVMGKDVMINDASKCYGAMKENVLVSEDLETYNMNSESETLSNSNKLDDVSSSMFETCQLPYLPEMNKDVANGVKEPECVDVLKLKNTQDVVSDLNVTSTMVEAGTPSYDKQETNEPHLPEVINERIICEVKDDTAVKELPKDSDVTMNLDYVKGTQEPGVKIDEEIVLSESNSPFVSMSAEEQFESESKSEAFEEIENPFSTKSKVAQSPPSSPKIVSKGYNLNFDDIDNMMNPFATKTKIRMSPPPGASPNTSLLSENENKTVIIEDKKTDKNINRRKSMPERKKPLKAKRHLNSTFDSTESGSPQTSVSKNSDAKITSKFEPKQVQSQENKSGVNKTDSHDIDSSTQAVNPDKLDVTMALTHEDTPKEPEATLNVNYLKEDAIVKPENESFTALSNETKVIKDVVMSDSCKSLTKPDTTSSSEQSTYFSAGASSTELTESKNVFNLPELDGHNPFVTKSKIRQSPARDLDMDNPFATKSKIKSSPETSFIGPHNDPNSTVTIDNENKEATYNFSNCSGSSKTSDEKDVTVHEVHTEDEDTLEGPFLEAADDKGADKLPELTADKVDMVDINPQENDEAAEMFIDAEAFEFLMNQNKTDEVAYSGKESLFLKFDPLFARRVTSEGVAAALNEIKRKQSTPKKTPKQDPPKEVDILSFEKPFVGPSDLNKTHDVPSAIGDKSDDIIVTASKPMMAVTPAVNPVVTPRKSLTPNRSNRLSMTFTSPAMAVIDRLLSLSGNSPSASLDTTVTQVERPHNEADQALTQLRELLAEKEIHVYNLRCESKELRSRLSSLETQMKALEAESAERLKKVNELNENLAEKTKMNRNMAAVVEEYERTIASLISETEQDKRRFAEERNQLIRDRDEQTAHLASMEVSFNDLHSKYEKSKQVIMGYKANEEAYKKSIQEFEENLSKMHTNYELLKQHATSKLNHANQELEKINKAHEAEILKFNAMIKRKELHITSLEESLTQKTKANEELTAICDELINKVG